MWAAIRQSEKRSDFAGLTPSIVLAVLATVALIFTLLPAGGQISHEHHIGNGVLYRPDTNGLYGRSEEAKPSEGQWYATPDGQWQTISLSRDWL